VLGIRYEFVILINRCVAACAFEQAFGWHISDDVTGPLTGFMGYARGPRVEKEGMMEKKRLERESGGTESG